MTVTLTLPSDVVELLERKALRSGKLLESYLTALAESDAQESAAPTVAPPAISDDEFDRLLIDLAATPPFSHLPLDFSRADIYAVHD